MSITLTGQPISKVRAHVGQWIWWRYIRESDGRELGDWGKLTKVTARSLCVTDMHGGEETLILSDLTFLGVATPRTTKPTWLDLRGGYIIGIVDHQDAVDSRFIPFDCIGKSEQHSTFWPGQSRGRWRWLFSDGLKAFVQESAPTPEQWSFVQAHITKRYGIQWWDNGYHDLHHMLAHVNAERALNPGADDE